MTQPALSPAQAADLLRYYGDIGVDTAVADQPGRWDAPLRLRSTAADLVGAPAARTASGRPSQRPPMNPPAIAEPVRPAPAATLGGDAAVSDARKAAKAAQTLEELEAAIRAFDGCSLKLTATTTVFADGHPDAAVMVVGEAPGAEEDRQGKPFVGRAGQLLDRMLAAIDLSRDATAYISNILPWRPPGNRQPNATEIALCLPFIERHIALKRPRVLILAGGTSAKALFQTNEGIMRLRGRWRDLAIPGLADPVPTLALFHPAFLLRQPAAKREAWRDLVQVRKRLIEMGLATPPA